MKKTINIHLGRQTFVIEEDAYILLDNYLKRVNFAFKNEQGKEEIIEDIEMRFAELLNQYLAESRKVIEMEDIQNGINSLGEFYDEESTEQAERENDQRYFNDQYNYQNGRKQVFRDPENGKVAGVVAGLANYFNIDVTVLRLVWVLSVLFIGFGFGLYILLWIVFPKLKSPKDRLKSEGRPITAENIRDEVNKASERINKSARSFQNKNEDSFNQAGRVIRKLLGIGFIFGALVSLFSIIILLVPIVDFIPVSGNEDFISFTEFLFLVIGHYGIYSLFWWAILLLGIGGFLFCCVSAYRLLSSTKSSFHTILFIISSVFIISGILVGIFGGVRLGRDFSVQTESLRTNYTISGNTLKISPFSKKHYNVNGIESFYVKNEKIYEDDVDFEFSNSLDSNYHVKLITSAHGSGRDQAAFRALRINYDVHLNNNDLRVSPMFHFPKKDGFRNQNMRILVLIPKGKTVQFGPEKIELFEDSEYRDFDDLTNY